LWAPIDSLGGGFKPMGEASFPETDGGPGDRTRPAIVYSVATSLDGFIADSDGGVDWLTPFQGPEVAAEFQAFEKSFGALLMGSRTYEGALQMGVDLFTPMGMPCWVFSKRNLPALSPAITVTTATPGQVVEELASRGIARAWLMGGTRLASSFRAANLISEYVLGVIPLVLGSGIPLFESPGPSARLRLIEAKSRPNGVVGLSYRVE
jgi:dihydrofolate reductase